MTGVENPGVDNAARDDKGGQGGSGNTGQINLTKNNYRLPFCHTHGDAHLFVKLCVCKKNV